MGAPIKRRLFVIVPAIAVIAIFSGLRLTWLNSGGYSAAYFASRTEMTYAAGAVISIVAFTIFQTVNRPALGRIGALPAQMAPPPRLKSVVCRPPSTGSHVPLSPVRTR